MCLEPHPTGLKFGEKQRALAFLGGSGNTITIYVLVILIGFNTTAVPVRLTTAKLLYCTGDTYITPETHGVFTVKHCLCWSIRIGVINTRGFGLKYNIIMRGGKRASDKGGKRNL